jgi:hypothetical protein
VLPAPSRLSAPDSVFSVGSNCAEPQTLAGALTAHAAGLTATEIVHIMTLGHAPYSEASFEKQFRHNAFFISFS